LSLQERQNSEALGPIIDPDKYNLKQIALKGANDIVLSIQKMDA
jgi:hypothetical protein